jgi:hypothetical protein
MSSALVRAPRSSSPANSFSFLLCLRSREEEEVFREDEIRAFALNRNFL